MRQRRKSKGEEEEDTEEQPKEDPKKKKEFEEMSKLKDRSGLGCVIYKELAERKSLPPPPLDPWKASRVPSAKYEPKFSTRYQSPMFACKYDRHVSSLELISFSHSGSHYQNLWRIRKFIKPFCF